MSNNAVSSQFEFRDVQMVSMEHASKTLDSLTRGTPTQIDRHMPYNPMPLQSVVLNEKLEPITNNHGFSNLMALNSQTRAIKSNAENEAFRQTGVKVTGLGQPSTSLSVKRKAEMEPLINSTIPNKRAVVPMGMSPRSPSSLQPFASLKKSVLMQSKVNAPSQSPALNRKFARNYSSSGKSSSHQVQTPKGRTMQLESTSKVRTESNDAVRSRMRDQLVAALSMVSQNQEESTNGDNYLVQAASNQQISTASQNPIADSNLAVAEEEKTQEIDNLLSEKGSSRSESGDNQNLFGDQSIYGNMETPFQSSKELHSSFIPVEDVSFEENFFGNDDLLQGNGLSWAFELDGGSVEDKGLVDFENSKLAPEESCRSTSDEKRASLEELALEIEAELFKLFGGVNRKYKEKGRSLLFNLKDRNNPELRERVMSGEILPDRLCSMTAEELASKELSEWRMAKAEELAQMVVLPDTDFGRRRLVKKTHKGEYQVEWEEEDSNVAAEVSVGDSLLSQSQRKDMDASVSSEADIVKDKATMERVSSRSENSELSGSFIIPNDGTDLLQGMMVDELKDSEFLPPIISLDEFMESLDSEPPFENLQVDGVRSTPSVAGENVEALGKGPPDSDTVGDALPKADEMPKAGAIPSVQKVPPPEASPARIEHIWAGILQLSISSSITTFGVFKSGEKTSTVEWSSSLEIKGRVRLDAFEKFVKELPMSRTRAVMVLHLVLKDKSSDRERANLAEAVESYISDERLGFAEPAAGVELYLCPPHDKMCDVLGNYISDHRADILNSTENGLIGLVVWRKVPISSTISPNSSTHHKRSSKRQQLTSGRPQGKDANVNLKSTPKPPPLAANNRQHTVTLLPPPPAAAEDDDSDIPPGFGPPANRDDDDLPEFNFSGNTNPSVVRTLPQTPTGSRVAPRPFDQIRQLIHKYGQTDASVSNRSLLDKQGSSVGLALEPWNDDDDDDMPEWMPNAPVPLHPSSPSFNRPVQPAHGYQHFRPMPMHQLHPGLAASGSGPGWQHGSRTPYGNPGNQPTGSGLSRRMPMLQVNLRQDGSTTRGF